MLKTVNWILNKQWIHSSAQPDDYRRLQLDHEQMFWYILTLLSGIMQMWDWLSKMIAMGIFISFAALLLFHLWIIGFHALIINRDHSKLTYVPQDLDASVTVLSLEHNDSTVINDSNLWRYHNLRELSLSFNPLQAIKPHALGCNPDLEVFKCTGCKLYRFPEDFGPASNSLKTIRFHWAIRNITAFNQMRLDQFTTLSHLTIRGLRGIDFDIKTFPTSLNQLDLSNMRLNTFPNLSLGRFPKLRSVNTAWNAFQETINFKCHSENNLDVNR